MPESDPISFTTTILAAFAAGSSVRMTLLVASTCVLPLISASTTAAC